MRSLVWQFGLKEKTHEIGLEYQTPLTSRGRLSYDQASNYVIHEVLPFQEKNVNSQISYFGFLIKEDLQSMYIATMTSTMVGCEDLIEGICGVSSGWGKESGTTVRECVNCMMGSFKETRSSTGNEKTSKDRSAACIC